MRVYDQDLSSATLVGEAVTSPDGKYRITYTEDQLAEGEVGNAPADAPASTLAAIVAASQLKPIRRAPTFGPVCPARAISS